MAIPGVKFSPGGTPAPSGSGTGLLPKELFNLLNDYLTGKEKVASFREALKPWLSGENSKETYSQIESFFKEISEDKNVRPQERSKAKEALIVLKDLKLEVDASRSGYEPAEKSSFSDLKAVLEEWQEREEVLSDQQIIGFKIDNKYPDTLPFMVISTTLFRVRNFIQDPAKGNPDFVKAAIRGWRSAPEFLRGDPQFKQPYERLIGVLSGNDFKLGKNILGARLALSLFRQVGEEKAPAVAAAPPVAASAPAAPEATRPAAPPAAPLRERLGLKENQIFGPNHQTIEEDKANSALFNVIMFLNEYIDAGNDDQDLGLFLTATRDWVIAPVYKTELSQKTRLALIDQLEKATRFDFVIRDPQLKLRIEKALVAIRDKTPDPSKIAPKPAAPPAPPAPPAPLDPLRAENIFKTPAQLAEWNSDKIQKDKEYKTLREALKAIQLFVKEAKGSLKSAIEEWMRAPVYEESLSQSAMVSLKFVLADPKVWGEDEQRRRAGLVLSRFREVEGDLLKAAKTAETELRKAYFFTGKFTKQWSSAKSKPEFAGLKNFIDQLPSYIGGSLAQKAGGPTPEEALKADFETWQKATLAFPEDRVLSAHAKTQIRGLLKARLDAVGFLEGPVRRRTQWALNLVESVAPSPAILTPPSLESPEEKALRELVQGVKGFVSRKIERTDIFSRIERWMESGLYRESQYQALVTEVSRLNVERSREVLDFLKETKEKKSAPTPSTARLENYRIARYHVHFSGVLSVTPKEKAIELRPENAQKGALAAYREFSEEVDPFTFEAHVVLRRDSKNKVDDVVFTDVKVHSLGKRPGDYVSLQEVELFMNFLMSRYRQNGQLRATDERLEFDIKITSETVPAKAPPPVEASAPVASAASEPMGPPAPATRVDATPLPGFEDEDDAKAKKVALAALEKAKQAVERFLNDGKEEVFTRAIEQWMGSEAYKHTICQDGERELEIKLRKVSVMDEDYSNAQQALVILKVTKDKISGRVKAPEAARPAAPAPAAGSSSTRTGMETIGPAPGSDQLKSVQADAIEPRRVPPGDSRKPFEEKTVTEALAALSKAYQDSQDVTFSFEATISLIQGDSPEDIKEINWIRTEFKFPASKSLTPPQQEAFKTKIVKAICQGFLFAEHGRIPIKLPARIIVQAPVEDLGPREKKPFNRQTAQDFVRRHGEGNRIYSNLLAKTHKTFNFSARITPTDTGHVELSPQYVMTLNSEDLTPEEKGELEGSLHGALEKSYDFGELFSHRNDEIVTLYLTQNGENKIEFKTKLPPAAATPSAGGGREVSVSLNVMDKGFVGSALQEYEGIGSTVTPAQKTVVADARRYLESGDAKALEALKANVARVNSSDPLFVSPQGRRTLVKEMDDLSNNSAASSDLRARASQVLKILPQPSKPSATGAAQGTTAVPASEILSWSTEDKDPKTERTLIVKVPAGKHITSITMDDKALKFKQAFLRSSGEKNIPLNVEKMRLSEGRHTIQVILSDGSSESVSWVIGNENGAVVAAALPEGREASTEAPREKEAPYLEVLSFTGSGSANLEREDGGGKSEGDKNARKAAALKKGTKSANVSFNGLLRRNPGATLKVEIKIEMDQEGYVVKVSQRNLEASGLKSTDVQSVLRTIATGFRGSTRWVAGTKEVTFNISLP